MDLGMGQTQNYQRQKPEYVGAGSDTEVRTKNICATNLGWDRKQLESRPIKRCQCKRYLAHSRSLLF